MKKKLTREQREERKVSIYTMRSLGKTYKEIGDEFGISRERVRQIGLKIEDGNPILFGNIQIKGKIERICPVCQKTFLVYSSKKREFVPWNAKANFTENTVLPKKRRRHITKNKKSDSRPIKRFANIIRNMLNTGTKNLKRIKKPCADTDNVNTNTVKTEIKW